jgi:hypothetical protein
VAACSSPAAGSLAWSVAVRLQPVQIIVNANRTVVATAGTSEMRFIRGILRILNRAIALPEIILLDLGPFGNVRAIVLAVEFSALRKVVRDVSDK